MYIIQKRPGDQIKLGRKGEYNARRIALDLSAWQTRYGDNGTVQLLYQRPGDATPYPVTLTREDHLAIWTVAAADTANSGNSGRAELRYYVDDALVKSAISQVVVEPSLGEPGNAPDEEQQSWLDQAVKAGSNAQNSAASASTSAQSAQTSADSASASASAAEASAQSASASAQSIQTSAETASTNASAAEASAQSAAASAVNAQNARDVVAASASAAEASAQGSASSAQSAQNAAETARNSAQSAKISADSASASASAAEGSAQSAAASAQSIQTAAETASTSASAAEASAQSAAASAVNAQKARDVVAASASAAEASAQDSASSAQSAQNAAETASTSASAAEASAQSSAASTVTAQNAANQAANSAQIAAAEVNAAIDALVDDAIATPNTLWSSQKIIDFLCLSGGEAYSTVNGITSGGGSVTVNNPVVGSLLNVSVTIDANPKYSKNPNPNSSNPLQGWSSVSLTHTVGANMASYDINFGCTVYGGFLDCTTGVLTITHKIQYFDGTEDWQTVSDGLTCHQVLHIDGISPNPNRKSRSGEKCSHYAVCTGAKLDGFTTGICTTSDGIEIYNPNYVQEDPAVWKEYLATLNANGDPLHVVVKLNEPYTIQLDLTQIFSFAGENTVRCSIGKFSVSYRENFRYELNALKDEVSQLKTDVNQLKSDVAALQG